MHTMHEENRTLINALRNELNRLKEDLAMLQKIRSRRASDASQEKSGESGKSLLNVW